MQWKGVKPSPDLSSRFFCYVPLHKIRYGVDFCLFWEPASFVSCSPARLHCSAGLLLLSLFSLSLLSLPSPSCFLEPSHYTTIGMVSNCAEVLIVFTFTLQIHLSQLSVSRSKQNFIIKLPN